MILVKVGFLENQHHFSNFGKAVCLNDNLTSEFLKIFQVWIINNDYEINSMKGSTR
jgi:hypothetical protein